MTDYELKNFLIQNGAINNFEIVNQPIFELVSKIETVNGSQLMIKNYQVGTLFIPNINNSINNFINNFINDTSKKWYIYNDGITNFHLNMNYIRTASIEIDDYTKLKQRTEKIKKIKNIINDK